MMSLLPAVPDKKLPQHIPTTSEIAPLVIKFSRDCVPLSCFSSTISCLISVFKWRLCRKYDGVTPECLAHNIVSLYDLQLPVQIVLVDLTHHFEIHIGVEEDVDKFSFADVCFHVQETILAAIKQVFDAMQLTEIEVSPAFLCPCHRVPMTHSASVYTFNSKLFLRCSRTERSVLVAQEKHTVWLETSATREERERPSLPKLMRLNLPVEVGAEYTNFGILLLNDESGSRIDAIKMGCLGKPDRIVLEILQEWVVGRGELPTWQMLIKTLRECKLTVLANKIEKRLDSGKF